MKTILSKIPRVMVVACGSGAGKTTVTCGILKTLINRGLKAASFKCGPDYIDPMFHTKVIGVNSRNLDVFLCGAETVKYLFGKNARDVDFSVIEGVMGMYDGQGLGDVGSANDLSLLTDTPEIVVLNPNGMGFSVVAQLHGFMSFKKNNIAGVLLNNTSESLFHYYREMIETNLKLKVYGYLPKTDGISFESRHLGLVTADEITDIDLKLNRIADLCEKSIDIDGLIELGRRSAAFEYTDKSVSKITSDEGGRNVRIGVAMDRAFCFYYEDALDLFRMLGAEIVPFSPLSDASLPDHLDGLIFGGGYPEEHARALSQNRSMKRHVKSAVEDGMPVIAECGGYMYLCRTLRDRFGDEFEMAGVIETSCFMTERLSRFGYVTMTAKEQNMLLCAGETINAHEFHYSDSEDNGDAFIARRINGKAYGCTHTRENLFAGYPHFHLWGNIHAAQNFIRKCEEKKNEFKRSH